MSSHDSDKKELALQLIKAGTTYSTIQEKYAIPKSTLSYWAQTSGIVRNREKQLLHLKKARNAAVISLRAKKEARLRVAEEVAEKVSRTISLESSGTGKCLLAMLYWAEGGKQDGNMKFTNTDPELVLFFLSLLRKHYELDEQRIHIALQLHSYHDQSAAIAFWSGKLCVPASQFWKVYIKPRSGRKKQYRRNFYGICNVHYSSSAIQRELLALNKALTQKLLADT